LRLLCWVLAVAYVVATRRTFFEGQTYVGLCVSLIAGFYIFPTISLLQTFVAGFRDRQNAKYLLCLFLDISPRDAFIGDLEERFALMSNEFGVKKATLCYWFQTFRSLGPLGWAWAKKAMKAASGLTALVELSRKLRP
jgi:hypothetical protein